MLLVILALLLTFTSLPVKSDSKIEARFIGPLKIEGIKPPPDDTTYDWWAWTVKDKDAYRMWWVRGVNFDKLYYAESKDGLSFTNTQQVLAPAENEYETQHVGHSCVIKHPSGRYYMFYEAPMHDEYTDGPDNNIYLATSTDGIHWNKFPSNNDPRPVIEGFNRRQKHYGVGLPSVYFKDGRFIINYVDDCEGQGNKMRRAESYDGVHWGSVAGRIEKDTRKHPVTMLGNVGDVRYCPALNRCLMAFTVNGQLVGQSKDDFSHDVYIAISLDPEGKKWASEPPKIWDLAKTSYNLNKSADPDNDLRLRTFPTFVSNELGQIEGRTFRVIYTKGRQARPDQDWKVHCGTWDLYMVEGNLGF